VHGVTGDKAKLSPGVTMVSATLADAGIRAAYYGNNPFGMDRLRRPGRWHAFHQPVREGQGSDCGKLVELMLGYAKKQQKARKRFFISALAYEPHVPYRYHQGITERYFPGPFDPPFAKWATGQLLVKVAQGKLPMNERRWAHLKGLYDGEVEYMDRCFGALLDGLKALGLRDQTAVIFTSDHGEGFWEHGKIGHAFGMYGELTNVPMVLLVPGLADRLVKVETPSGHVDIVPTVLDLLQVSGDPRLQGISLLPLARRAGSWTPRVVTMEYGRSYALRSRRFKYAVDYGGKEELFDARKDPAEQRPINDRSPAVLRYFRDLAGFYLAHRVDWREASWGPVNNHQRGLIEYLARQR
jgi:arylsulfatase A-like enzyme